MTHKPEKAIMGDIVKVFLDPTTKAEFEGFAELLYYYCCDLLTGTSWWRVRMLDTNEICKREIDDRHDLHRKG